MPGVLIIEALAQTSAILVAKSAGDEAKDKLVYFISIDKVKFRKPVIPGDSLELKVTAIQHRGAVWKFEGKALVKNEVVTEASFAAMIIDNDDK
jgi:3-hydroxyacyl-[acyl-carrier-protein] dehydratase